MCESLGQYPVPPKKSVKYLILFFFLIVLAIHYFDPLEFNVNLRTGFSISAKQAV
jgi:hypothetical protein